MEEDSIKKAQGRVLTKGNLALVVILLLIGIIWLITSLNDSPAQEVKMPEPQEVPKIYNTSNVSNLLDTLDVITSILNLFPILLIMYIFVIILNAMRGFFSYDY